MRFSRSHLLWLSSGLVFRLILLFWGVHQDSVSSLPYTDVDYSVFNHGTNLLVNGCQIQSILHHDEQSKDQQFQDWQDLQDPKGFNCATGFIPSLARFTLLNDPLSKPASSKGGDEGRLVNSILNNRESFEFKWTMFCYDLIRPIFMRFATLGNPFQRSTFRYTPLLSLILAPSHASWFPLTEKYYGKLLFILCDLVVGILMWDLLDGRRDRRDTRGKHDWLVGIIWLLNPIVAQISTRGSSESIIGVLVLGFLAMFLRFNPEIPIDFVGSNATSDIEVENAFSMEVEHKRKEEIDIAKAKQLSLEPSSNGSATHSNSQASSSKTRSPSDHHASSDLKHDLDTHTPSKLQSQDPTTPSTLAPPPFPLSQCTEPISLWSLTNLLSPILYSLSIHFKLYPIVYSISIASHLHHTSNVDSYGRRSGNEGLKRHLGWVRFASVAGISYGLINFGVYLL